GGEGVVGGQGRRSVVADPIGFVDHERSQAEDMRDLGDLCIACDCRPRALKSLQADGRRRKGLEWMKRADANTRAASEERVENIESARAREVDDERARFDRGLGGD